MADKVEDKAAEAKREELRGRMQQLLDQSNAMAAVVATLGDSDEAKQVKAGLASQTTVLEQTLAELAPITIPPGQFDEDEEEDEEAEPEGGEPPQQPQQ